MVSVLMLPAGRGDFFIIKYGTAREEHFIFIDGGDASATVLYKKILIDFLKHNKRIDAIIFTHIDDDHIAGALGAVLSVPELPPIGKIYLNTGQGVEDRCKDFVCNGYPEHESREYLHSKHKQHSVPKALSLMEVLTARGLSDKIISCTCQGEIIPMNGAVMKIISPGMKELKKYLKVWNKEKIKCTKQHAGIKREPLKDLITYEGEAVKEDTRAVNGSSIAFLLECEEARLVFLGDAHPSVCVDGILKFYPDGVQADLIKIPHHGSKHNFSEKMYQLLQSDRFLLSTNGAGVHPDPVFLGKLFYHFPKAVLYCNGNWMRGYGLTDNDKKKYLNAKDPRIILLKDDVALSSSLIISGKYKE